MNCKAIEVQVEDQFRFRTNTETQLLGRGILFSKKYLYEESKFHYIFLWKTEPFIRNTAESEIH